MSAPSQSKCHSQHPLEESEDHADNRVAACEKSTERFTALSRDDLIRSIMQLEKKTMEQRACLRDQESRIQKAEEEVERLKEEKAKLQLSCEARKQKVAHSDSLDVPFCEDMDALCNVITAGIRQSSVEDRQMKCISKLKSRVNGMDSIIQSHALLINNQEEALSSLCSLVSRLFDTIGEARTDEQERLYQEFQLSYLQTDNSDVENVLDVDPYPTHGAALPLSPLPTTPRATDDADFSLSSFLQYVSATMITPSFQNESVLLSDQAVGEIRAFVSSFLDVMAAILQNRVQKGEWASSALEQSCSGCRRPFSVSRRKHHCRWCGRVFCNACSRHRVSLSFLGTHQRVCDSCYCVCINVPIALHDLSSR